MDCLIRNDDAYYRRIRKLDYSQQAYFFLLYHKIFGLSSCCTRKFSTNFAKSLDFYDLIC